MNSFRYDPLQEKLPPRDNGESALTYNLWGEKPLPPGDGPCLAAFKHRGKPISFNRLLKVSSIDSNFSDSDSASSGGQAHVFEVTIEGEQYALKVFKFSNLKTLRHDTFRNFNHKVKDFAILRESDPFFAECRAYGRIQEIEKDESVGEIAVPCYGFLGLLPELCERQIFAAEPFNITDWNRSPLDLSKPVEKREPFRALVKKLITHPKAIIEPHKMLSDLQTLNTGGVYQRDISARNYVGGLLVDFGMAWTRPHWILEVLGDNYLEKRKTDELRAFDRMMKENRIKTTARAWNPVPSPPATAEKETIRPSLKQTPTKKRKRTNEFTAQQLSSSPAKGLETPTRRSPRQQPRRDYSNTCSNRPERRKRKKRQRQTR